MASVVENEPLDLLTGDPPNQPVPQPIQGNPTGNKYLINGVNFLIALSHVAI